MIGTDAFQETPIVEVTRQITKHNYLVMDVRDLPRIVKEVRRRHRHCAPCCCQSSCSLKHSIWASCQLSVATEQVSGSVAVNFAQQL